jgi:N-sulfoglucosamine sulfohydrolase
MYDYMHSSACPFDKLMEASDVATLGGKSDLKTLTGYLKHPNSAIRYWGATGLLILKKDAEPAIPALKEANKDKSVAVSTLAAEALYGLGEKETAVKTYIRLLKDTVENKPFDLVFVLNSIDAVKAVSPGLTSAIQQLTSSKEPKTDAENKLEKNVNYTLEWILKK